MRVGILGAGFTGLASGLRLLQQGHLVTIFDKESEVGGLASGFKQPGWQWSLEKAYHHWFTSDSAALNLASDLNFPVIIKRPATNVFIQGQILPFDSASSLLKFPYFSLLDKLRTGWTLAYLKIINNYRLFDHQTALPWIKNNMGQNSTNLIWDPLFSGKFGDYKDQIALTWFWARIKKRTPSLAYPKGGFRQFSQAISQKISNLGGKILLNNPVLDLSSNEKQVLVRSNKQVDIFDKVVVTLPTPLFCQIANGLSQSYIKRVSQVKYLHALNLILILKKPLLKDSYWLNITDKNFPFLILAEHTNFMDPVHYNNQHILYIGNYLPSNHPYLKMSAKQLLKVFDPYLKKVSPDYQQYIINYRLFFSPFAQPIVDTSYTKNLPADISGKDAFKSPLKNVYLANLSMVYPWDRGTNYAIEMGEKLARLINMMNDKDQ